MIEAYSKTKPYDHQRTAFEKSKDAKFFGLFMEQGTGKTYVSLANVEYLFRTGRINTLVVLAPSGVHQNWANNEIPKHLPSYPDRTVTVVWDTYAGAKKTNLMWWKIVNCPKDSLLIVTANIEALRLQRFREVLETILPARRVLTLVDESTIIKNHSSQQSKLASAIGEGSAYRRILTGTPITQGPLDLWGQIRFLSKTALPWTSYTAFKAMFAVEVLVRTSGNRMFPKITGYRDLDKLTTAIEPFTFRVTKDECLDLPPKIYATRNIELTDEQRRMYRSLLNASFATIPEGVVTSTLALTTMLRLHQITIGHTTTDEGISVDLPSNRPEALRLLLSETTGKGLIFCRFRRDIENIQSMLDDSSIYALYHGGVDEAGRQSSLSRFRSDPNCRWLLASRSASRGLTLTEAQNVIYYSQGYSLEDRLQSEDRIHRIGQTKSTLYIDLITPGTVEEKIIAALKNKQDLANQVLTKERLYDMLRLEDDIPM